MQNSQWEISSGRKKKFGKIASFVAQLAKNPPAMRETWVDLWVGKMPWRRDNRCRNTQIQERELRLCVCVYYICVCVYIYIYVYFSHK